MANDHGYIQYSTRRNQGKAAIRQAESFRQIAQKVGCTEQKNDEG